MLPILLLDVKGDDYTYPISITATPARASAYPLERIQRLRANNTKRKHQLLLPDAVRLHVQLHPSPVTSISVHPERQANTATPHTPRWTPIDHRIRHMK